MTDRYAKSNCLELLIKAYTGDAVKVQRIKRKAVNLRNPADNDVDYGATYRCREVFGE